MIDVYVTGLSIDMGRQGENLARNIYFDLSELVSTYGEGTATLVYVRPSERAPYVCTTVRTGTFLIWSPTSTDTAYSGTGKCELRWVVGETLAKSIVYNTSIAPSIMSANQVPDPYLSWYDAMMDYIKNNYSESGAPQEVREAIYTLLSKAAYIETGLEDELATVQAWAAEHFTITNNLTNVTTNNSTGIVASGSSYTATLTAVSGYALGAVTVTMGDEDVTSTVYSGGVITIAEVTGDVVITASGVAAVVSLSAVYTPSRNVYDDFSLSDLTNDLVVTATYGDSSTAVIPSSDYTLSGTLEAGTTSVVMVSYGGKTTTFNVTVSTPLYPFTVGTHNFTSPAGTIEVINGNTGIITNSTANSNDIHACFFNLSANTSACNSTNNYAKDGSTIFTIPAGSTVRVKTIINSFTTTSSTMKIGSAMRAFNGSTLVTQMRVVEDTFLNTIEEGHVFEATQTFDADTVIGCIGMWFGGRGNKSAASINVSYIIYVDDVRYV